MLPCFPIENIVDSSAVDPKFLGKLISIKWRILYLSNNFFGQLGTLFFLPTLYPMTAFRKHVICIVLVSSQEKMIRIDAKSIVTRVKYAFSFRDFSIE